MEDRPKDERFPSNSKYTNIPQNKKKPDEKKPVESVAIGKLIQKKKTLGEKFSETFLATDIHSVFQHIIFDVLVPSAKDTLYDIVRGSMNMLLFGNRNGNGRTNRNEGTGGIRIYRDYDRFYDRPGSASSGNSNRSSDERTSQPSSTRDVLEEIRFDSKSEADSVLDNLKLLIEEYGVASVKDLYNLAGMKTDFTKDKYGWFELNDRVAGVIRIREGWLLKLPRPIVID